MRTTRVNVFAVMALLWVLATTGQPTIAYGQAGKGDSLPPTITFVFPYAAGGGGDIILRIVARYLPKYLPGPPTTVVQNVAGAGGRAGVQVVYRSKPNGSVVGATYSPSALGNQMIYSAEAGYDFTKFVVLTSTYHQPYSIAVGPKTPYKNLADLKKAGKQVVFCNEGGGVSLAYIVVAAKEVGFPYRLIPGYSGAPDATAGMLRGDCEAVSYGVDFVARYLKEGVRPITVHGQERFKPWPEVPTSKEQGYSLDLQNNVVFFLPPGTPSEIANVFREALTKAHQDKELLDAVRKAKFRPTFADANQTQQMVSELNHLFSKYAAELREAETKVK